MAAPNIVLSKKQVLLTQSASVVGIIPLDNKKLSFGQIMAVSDIVDNAVLGTVVSYDPSKGSSFMYGSTIYILIDESYISATEGYVP